MASRPVSGAAMLVVTVALVVIMLALSWLAGPFGRTRQINQEPTPSWPASAPP